ncbi:MAG TPA: ABC transporter permease [Blastocatellia bacterium]|nr:ABC transporter permease [Blastocatellia bacterium]
MESFLKDLRYGIRMLLKKPGFTLVAVLTLAIGIGANTAIFSVIDAILIRPLPFPDSDRMVLAYTKTSRVPQQFVSYPDFQDWREQSRSFEQMSAFATQSVNLTGEDEPARVRGGFVSENFLRLVGVEPEAGRGFLPGEDLPGAERVVVVNHELWQARYGGDPSFVGRKLTLNGEVFTVAGVMPRGFRFPLDEVEVWIPFSNYLNLSMDRKTPTTGVVGRLKSGVSLEQARAELDTIASALSAKYPDTNADRGVYIARLQEVLVEGIRPALLILLGAVGLVLLIACANVGNLLLARTVGRQKEIAVRSAVGATRARIARQFLTETMLLSAVGGAAGLLVGLWGLDLLTAISPASLIPDPAMIELNGTVLGFTTGISLLTGLAFGLAPAIRFSRPNLVESLNEGGRSSGENLNNSRVRKALVVSQVALAMVVLIASGLTVRSLIKVLKVDPGFNPSNLLTMEYRIPRTKYPEAAHQWNFHKQVVERVKSLPGVRSASVVLALPFSGNAGSTEFVLPDRAEPAPGSELRSQMNRADKDFFETMGIPLLKGRAFTDQDDAASPPVVVINQTMARQFWPDDDPLGKQVRLSDPKITATVIGVVGDVKQGELDDKSVPQIYAAYSQAPFIFATLVVRTDSDPMNMAGAVRGSVWSVDKDQPVWKVRTQQSLLDGSVGQRRFVATLLGLFSGIALLLAAVGVYGVITYSVNQRTHEIGIRMALGARPAAILGMVMRQGMLMIFAGLAIGLAASFLLTRYLSSLLFAVSPTDATTFAGIAGLLALVALFACYIPARRATRVDPIMALKYE